MTAPDTHDLELRGCTPEPLMSYLKALGVLRLIHEQKDAGVFGWWTNDCFRLRTRLSLNELFKFFVNEYKPTPIVGPWAGGSGFFEKDDKKAVKALAGSASPRVATYRAVIQQVRQILEEEGVSDKPTDEKKAELIRRYRRELPDDVVSWMDAVMVLQSENQRFAPLLGTGGNDGKLNFTYNFMQRIVKLVLPNLIVDPSRSEDWLKAALQGMSATLDDASVGQFAPGRAGGPNSTQGLEGDALDNPWDFVLMLEGALFFAGAVVRRYGIGGDVRSSFPFTVDAVSAGFDSSAAEDEKGARGEIWLPIWSRPATVYELTQLFGEGRADVSGRPARNALDFARAVAELGIDRGILAFTRYGFLKRSGKAYLATPLGRWSVVRRTDVDLLREADSWLNAFRRAASNKGAPPRYGAALRCIENAIFDFCKYGGPHFFQNILIAFGNAERELALEKSVGPRAKSDQGANETQGSLMPLSGLSPGWRLSANDQTPEFQLAQAIAFIYDPLLGPLRANLEPVDWRKGCRIWAEKERRVVWTAADLSTNLAQVLERRLMDGALKGCANLPINSPISASLYDITAFLDHRVDFQRIESLLWGMILLNPPNSLADKCEKMPPETPIPRDYALLKLLFLPKPLVGEWQGQYRYWRFAKSGEDGLKIRPEPQILSLLRAGRIGEACARAAYRLRVSGLTPMPGPTAEGRRRDGVWSEIINPIRGIRLAAALLIPISATSVNRLVHLVCRSETAEELESMNVVTQGDTP